LTIKNKWLRQVSVALILALVLSLISCGRENGTTGEERTTEKPTSKISVEDASFLSVPADFSGKDFTEKHRGEGSALRSRFDLGTSRQLSGECTVVLFFISDDESRWEKDAVLSFTERIVIPALSYLENEAQKFGLSLSFSVKRYAAGLSPQIDPVYHGTVNRDLRLSGSTKDIPRQMASLLGYGDEMELRRAMIRQWNANESIFPIMLLNKSGTAYARPQISGEVVDHWEHVVLFADGLQDPEGLWKIHSDRSAATAHEILHLFGAEDFYVPEERLLWAEKHYREDIMLLDSYRIEKLSVGKVTAYQLGWIDQPPEEMNEIPWQ